jgi:hypothetical protein
MAPFLPIYYLPPLSVEQVADDVKALRKAMRGIGTDETAIIKILGHRTDMQMQQIAAAYKSTHGKTLQEELKSEISGEFLNACLNLVNPMPEFDAKMIEKAINGFGTDEGLLIQSICGRTNAEILALSAAYAKLFTKDITAQVANDLSGDSKTLFMGLLKGCRNETGVGISLEKDLETLHNSSTGKLGTDESRFISLFTDRSDIALHSCFNSYENKYKKSILSVIKSEFMGESEKVLLGAGK